ncbi:CvfB family protein [Azotosporobacter soli]|uniref:CvfB family protein n=1 Tax=Azotosporobacter soli TaxID=3055040 RepID=UPI0031FEF146
MKTENNSPYSPGQVAVLKVVRMSDLGAFLDGGTGNTSEDILLYKERMPAEIKIGDEVEVYLYLDPKGRLAASTKLPKMKEGQVARVQVINTTKDGAFVDIGAERGVFLPFAGMRGRLKEGDRIWVKLYTDKSGRPAVTMEVEDELRRASKPATTAKLGDWLEASIYNAGEDGWFLFVMPERYLAYLHRSEAIGQLLVGHEVKVRVTFIREDGRINVSMRLPKEDAIDKDAQAILDVLEARQGRMPYGDTTSAEVVREKFSMSKAAFKRSLGRLMRDGRVRQEEGWTMLLEPKE